MDATTKGSRAYYRIEVSSDVFTQTPVSYVALKVVE
jgi:hypothetical protein